MIEIIIVIAIMGIMVGSSVSMMGHIRYANTKKIVESMDAALSKQRVTTMSKQGTPYLYIYKLSDGYYMKQLTQKLDSFDAAKLNADGTKLSGSSVVISMENGTDTKEVKDDKFIRIAYKKSGAFKTAEYVNSADGTGNLDGNKIVIEGSSTYTITLVKDTGKHIVE